MKTEVYISKNQPDITKLSEYLSRPVHHESLIIPTRKLRKNEVDISSGFRLNILAETNKALSVISDDFKNFMAVCMQTTLNDNGFEIVARIGEITNLPTGACEAFEIHTRKDKCTITAQSIDGLRRAFVYLEDEMTLRRYPALKREKNNYYKTARLRISRSPIASYRYGGGWELENDHEFYPDEYLNGLMHCGINAIWVAGIFRNLIKSKIIPEATPEVDNKSLERLNELVSRAADYGIKVYLFCMEPRTLPAESNVFKKYPELKGRSWCRGGDKWETSLCTSSAMVQEYMKESIRELFTAVPNLGGMIQIFSGERLTNCYTYGDNYPDKTMPCERCLDKQRGEVLTDVINLYNREIKKVAPRAEFIAWSYGMYAQVRNVKEYIVDNMDRKIIWLENFEHNGRKKYFNKFIENAEYSLCYLGPCPEFENILSRADLNGKEVFAKIQLGTTYEQSAIPYIPVPESVHEKCKFINKKSIPGVFVSWIIGGYPDLMLKASDEALRLPMLKQSDFLKRLAAIYWGEELADKVVLAWQHFFKAFQNYPIDKNTFYYGPITRCPAYHLYLEPQNLTTIKWVYNWGIDRERKQQPFYDDMNENWLGQFSVGEMIALYRSIAEEWRNGVTILNNMANETGRTAHSIQAAVAEAALIQFESAANVYEFYHLRESWLNSHSKELSNRLANIVENDIELAEKMKNLLPVDPRLGFQSELIYYVFSEELLDEKIKQSRSVYLELKKHAKS